MEKESDYNSVEFKPSIPELQLDALTTDLNLTQTGKFREA